MRGAVKKGRREKTEVLYSVAILEYVDVGKGGERKGVGSCSVRGEEKVRGVWCATK